MKTKKADKKKKVKMPRIPIVGALKLRDGGAHSSKKGDKGYNRGAAKKSLRNLELI